MRLIDADALKASIEKKDRYNLGGEGRIVVCGMLDDAPTIDAEPIVRCKDCEFVDTLECPMNYIDHQRLIFSNRSPDWFCAEGVRKDET